MTAPSKRWRPTVPQIVFAATAAVGLWRHDPVGLFLAAALALTILIDLWAWRKRP